MPEATRKPAGSAEETRRCGCDESKDLRHRLDLTTRAYVECTGERKSLRERLHATEDRLSECDEADSLALHEMRAVIDDEKLWRDEEQEEAGDYQARMVELAAEFKAWRDRALKAEARVQSLRVWLRGLLQRVDETLGAVEAADLGDG